MTTKKKYEKPAMQVFELKQTQQLLTGSSQASMNIEYEEEDF